MAITSELIGKLGGANVETEKVSTPAKSGVSHLTRIEVPAGKTLLVAVEGTSSRNATGLAAISILAGKTIIGGAPNSSSTVGGVTTLTDSTDISIDMASSSNSFTGTIYTVEL